MFSNNRLLIKDNVKCALVDTNFIFLCWESIICYAHLSKHFSTQEYQIRNIHVIYIKALLSFFIVYRHYVMCSFCLYYLILSSTVPLDRIPTRTSTMEIIWGRFVKWYPSSSLCFISWLKRIKLKSKKILYLFDGLSLIIQYNTIHFICISFLCLFTFKTTPIYTNPANQILSCICLTVRLWLQIGIIETNQTERLAFLGDLWSEAGHRIIIFLPTGFLVWIWSCFSALLPLGSPTSHYCCHV